MAAVACNGMLSPTFVHESTLTSSRPSIRKLTSVPCLSQSRKNRTQCKVQISCSSKETVTEKIATSLTALGLSSALIFGAVPPSFASESNILQEPPPVTHVIDDAGVLSRVTKADIKNLLNDLEDRTGFHIDVVTLRKITVSQLLADMKLEIRRESIGLQTMQMKCSMRFCKMSLTSGSSTSQRTLRCK